jgi:hypothetical protein
MESEDDSEASQDTSLLIPKAVATAPTAREVLRHLEYPERRNSGIHDPAFDDEVATSKASAVAADNQVEAKSFWQVQAIARVQRSYLKAFGLLKEYRFYDAWCEFERCEVAIASLKRHAVIERGDPTRIDYIETMVKRWQAQFPYKVFLSPEILKKRMECSICGAKVSLRNPCGHEKGQIYNGEECLHRIVASEFLSISIVTDPVQKYSVAFIATDDGSGSRDHYDYGNVRFAIDRLASAFHGWHVEAETRTFPISVVSHLPPESPCPCASGKPFGDCCASKPEVTIPHKQFTFYVPPPPEFPHDVLRV